MVYEIWLWSQYVKAFHFVFYKVPIHSIDEREQQSKRKWQVPKSELYPFSTEYRIQ